MKKRRAKEETQNLQVSKKFLQDLLLPFKDLPTDKFYVVDVGDKIEIRWKGGVLNTS